MAHINTEEIDLRPTWQRLQVPAPRPSSRAPSLSWTGDFSGLRQLQNERHSQRMPYIVGAIVIALAVAFMWPAAKPLPPSMRAPALVPAVVKQPEPAPSVVTADPAGRRLEAKKTSTALPKKRAKARMAF